MATLLHFNCAATLKRCPADPAATESAQRNRRLTAGHAPMRWEPSIAEPSESKRSRSRSHHKHAEPVLVHQVRTAAECAHSEASLNACLEFSIGTMWQHVCDCMI